MIDTNSLKLKIWREMESFGFDMEIQDALMSQMTPDDQDGVWELRIAGWPDQFFAINQSWKPGENLKIMVLPRTLKGWRDTPELVRAAGIGLN